MAVTMVGTSADLMVERSDMKLVDGSVGLMVGMKELLMVVM